MRALAFIFVSRVRCLWQRAGGSTLPSLPCGPACAACDPRISRALP